MAFVRGLPLVLIIWSASTVAESQAETTALNAARESITKSELKSHVDTLADDTFEGREAGARGGHASAGYLVKHLQDLGLQPAGERGSYYQAFDGSCRNLLAKLEGSDPELKQEVVMIGAHYDHVGYGSQRNSYGPWGYIHNGADDNASGVAGLLEVAQAFCRLSEPPRRTIVFAFWDAEEKGLLGSKHWMRTPTIPLQQVKCFVNVDMIGRLVKERVEVYGTRSAPGFRRLVSTANTANLDLDFTWKMKDDSDHWPFFAQGIPVLMFHTGLHADYHRPSDDAERINHEGLERVSRLLFETVLSLAQQDAFANFRPESRRENEDVHRSVEQATPPPPARLGMSWREEELAGKVQLHATAIVRGSAAEQAGLKQGDVIRRLNGQDIPNDKWFRQQVLAAKAPIQLTVFSGTSAERQATVNLAGSPIRFGITVREDAGEPGIPLITNVVVGSPAAEAGLRVADRIEAVDGHSFANLTEYYQLLDKAHGTIRLRIERRGRIQEAELQLID